LTIIEHNVHCFTRGRTSRALQLCVKNKRLHVTYDAVQHRIVTTV